MSVYAFSPLKQGQAIIIKSRLPIRARRATLQWIRQEHYSMYKMGLKVANGSIEPEKERTHR